MSWKPLYLLSYDENETVLNVRQKIPYFVGTLSEVGNIIRLVNHSNLVLYDDLAILSKDDEDEEEYHLSDDEKIIVL